MRAGIIWFLIPSLLLGVLSFYFPYIYAIIPAHESVACICDLQQKAHMAHKIKDWQVTSMILINTVMFYGVNWIFLIVNIMMLFRIRHINDKLWVRKEMGAIVVVWTFFCYFQFTFYLLDQVRSCEATYSRK